jgi:hypothetical protein
MTSKVISSMTDASMVSHAAMLAASGNTSSMRGVLIGSVLVRIKPDESKAVRGLLETGFAQALAGQGNKVLDRHFATAKNYASRCFAAAKEDNWKAAGLGAIDTNAELDTVIDAMFPLFQTYWGTIAAIKAAGRDSKPKERAKGGEGDKGDKGDKGGEGGEGGEAQASATLLEIVEHLVGRLSERLPDEGANYALDAATLAYMRDALNTELAKRQAEVAEQLDKAA